jgi:uncharacterized protein GlcG (DUF336 family)
MARQLTLEVAERVVEAGKKKAETTVGFQMTTRDLTQMVQPGAPLYGIESVGGGRVAVFGSWIPLTDEDGRVVGGVGVSLEEDHDVAAATGCRSWWAAAATPTSATCSATA